MQFDPARQGYYLGIRQLVGEGHDQYVDDGFTSPDGRFLYVSRPSLADVAQDTKVPGVQVIAAGSRVANPGRLLARAADLVREARNLADFVLIVTYAAGGTAFA